MGDKGLGHGTFEPRTPDELHGPRDREVEVQPNRLLVTVILSPLPSCLFRPTKERYRGMEPQNQDRHCCRKVLIPKREYQEEGRCRGWSGGFVIKEGKEESGIPLLSKGDSNRDPRSYRERPEEWGGIYTGSSLRQGNLVDTS